MEVENNFVVDWLSEAHANLILAYIERGQQLEEALINRWLESRQR